MPIRTLLLNFAAVLMICSQLLAAEYYVDNVPNNGNGTSANPFNSFNSALNAAQPGDIILVLPGTYNQTISSERDGSANQRITIKAYNPADRPLVTSSGQVIYINHSHITLDGLIIDGQFANSDVFRIKEGGDNLTIRNCEIRNGTKDGIDLTGADDVLIENCEIHHFLGGTINNQVDAHGVVACSQNNLTIRGCNIYYVSGDCFQTDPNRGSPLWDNVVIEDSKLWTGPLPADAAGWNAGEIPGENAVDTKINGSAVNSSYRANLTIRNVEAYGFVSGYINNRAAFNLKEKINCTLIAVKVYDSEIAFRVRGPGSYGGAHVTIINSIAYDNEKTFRAEDGVEMLHIYNCTFDKGNGDTYFQNVSGGYNSSGFDLRNSLFTGTKPGDASDPSNMSAGSSYFVNLTAHNYRLSSASPAIDGGEDITEVTDDYDGNPRYLGSYDVGAFEYDSSSGLDDPANPAIRGFYLHPNYPNPFNPATNIAFDMVNSARVRLNIFDIVGNKVRSLVDGLLPAGEHRLQWDGRDNSGQVVASGIYFYRIEVGTASQTRKMHLLR